MSIIRESRAPHIFRQAEGYLPDTLANRQLLTDVVSNPKNLLGSDKYGNEPCQERLMTEQQAFKAMILFLECHFNHTQSDDIAALLGDLQLLDDGLTADPAAWQEWMECVETIESKANRPAITTAR